MKKVTAVELLIQNILEDQTIKAKSISEWVMVFEKAKEMEKEQIIDTFQDSRILSVTNNCSSGKQYYNETYKSE
jgi:hypothetical protein